MKISFKLCMAGVLCAILLISCAQPTGAPTNPVTNRTHLVKFDYNYEGSIIASTIINDGEYLSKPTVPDRSGYDLIGWYLEKTCITEFNFLNPIKSDVTLYACWDNSTGLGVGSDPSLYTVEGFTEKLFGPISAYENSMHKTFANGDYIIVIGVYDYPMPKRRETTIAIRYSDTNAYVNGASIYKASQYIGYFLKGDAVSFSKNEQTLFVSRNPSGVDDNSNISIDGIYQNDLSITQFFETKGFGTLTIVSYSENLISIKASGKLPAGKYIKQ